jgi:hypothetical protein
MSLLRLLRHLIAEDWSVRRIFPRARLDAIRRVIGQQERRHSGQLRFAVEGGLPLWNLLRGQGARERAVEWFSALRIWDTEHNNGVLVYLLLADSQVEIVADRGIHAKVGDAAWEAICGEMQHCFAQRRFEQGVILGITSISDLLAKHFPPVSANRNELSDEPLVLK